MRSYGYDLSMEVHRVLEVTTERHERRDRPDCDDHDVYEVRVVHQRHDGGKGCYVLRLFADADRDIGIVKWAGSDAVTTDLLALAVTGNLTRAVLMTALGRAYAAALDDRGES